MCLDCGAGVVCWVIMFQFWCLDANATLLEKLDLPIWMSWLGGAAKCP